MLSGKGSSLRETAVDVYGDSSNIDAIRSRIVNAALYILAIVGVVPLALSTLRLMRVGMQKTGYLYLATYLVVLGVAFTHRHFSLRGRTVALACAIFIFAVGSLLSWGIIGYGVTLLLLFVTVTSGILGFRAGMIAAASSVVALSSVFAGLRLGFVKYDIDVAGHLSSTEAWILAIANLVAMTVGVAASLGRLHSALLQSIDVLKRRTAELQKANEERARLVTAIEQTPDGIVITDTDGAIQYVNPAYERITGYTREELAGKNPRILKSGKHDVGFYRELWQRLKRGETWSGRLTNKKKDGTLFVEEATISPVRDAEGNTVNFVGVKIDVTERLRLEARIQQSQKLEAIGTLAGGIAHDFNNILGAIIGYSEMGLTKVAPDSKLHGDLERILQAGTRASSLVRQILSFSRQKRQEHQHISMAPIITEALKLLRATLPATIEIRQSLTTEGRVLADATEIHQVVMNLCTNAGLAMREHGGVLELALGEIYLDPVSVMEYPGLNPGKFVLLKVRDTGCGIPPETLGRVFEPFFTTRAEAEGTGLGLSVVHGIVHNCGGTITICSEVGRGTCFEVFLPAIETRASGANSDLASSLPGHERILFVDDEQPIVELIREALGGLGYSITAFQSSPEALEAFRSAPSSYDLVITDMTMPSLTGEDLATRVKEIRREIPIILITGYSERMSAHRAEELGITEFLTKPIRISQLTQVIRGIFGHRPSLAQKESSKKNSTA